MIIPIELRFKADKGSKSAFRTDKTIKSHDVNSVEFHISIEGLELTDSHTAKILSVFHSSKSQVNVDCEIVDGKIIYKPDTSLISRHEHVTNYVYVYHNNQSLDVREFIYVVDLSKIDETSLEVKEVYDQSYAELLTEFEARLQDYKDSLPQASDLRAEVDVILDKFKVDSDAKLSQYDADAQQVIADNQTAFGVAESGRQSTYEQAEDIRNQVSNQAVADWEQGADALLETVEGNESARVDAEETRKTAETDRVSSESTRKTNETNRISNEQGRATAESDRENAEAQRKIDHANRSAELADKADKVVMNNLITNGDFSDGTEGWLQTGYNTGFEVIDGVAKTTEYSSSTRSFIQTLPEQPNIGDLTYVSINTRIDHPDKLRNMYVLSAYSALAKNIIAGPITNVTSEFMRTSGIVRHDGIFHLRVLYNFIETGEYPAYLKDVVAINLTQTFGAGHEPTKEEMDKLIEITGYIDGEYALNNKEMLIWTLSLIRRNKNAIVALGGA